VADIDLSKLVSRLLRPARPQLAEALFATQEARSATEAWYRLHQRGLLPPGWESAPARGFVFVEEDGVRWGPLGSLHPPVHAIPGSVEACVALASDPEGIQAAERLADECITAWAAWGVKAPARRVWDVVLRAGPPVFVSAPTVLEEAGAVVRYAHELAAWDRLVLVGDRLLTHAQALLDAQTGHRVRLDLADVFRDAWLWALACDEGLKVPVTDDDLAPHIPGALAGRRFADIPDPFAPWFALSDTGYLLRLVDRDELLLVAEQIPPQELACSVVQGHVSAR